jgi:hypothetical protein
MGTRGKGILMKAPTAVRTAKRAERVMVLTGKRMIYLHCQPRYFLVDITWGNSTVGGDK